MKWYYYYQPKRHIYTANLWTMPTKQIVFWVEKIFKPHLEGVKVDHKLNLFMATEYPFLCHISFIKRAKIYWKMRRWILVMEGELKRRKDKEYRAFINDIIHKPFDETTVLVFADKVQEMVGESYARKIRKWANIRATTEAQLRRKVQDATQLT